MREIGVPAAGAGASPASAHRSGLRYRWLTPLDDGTACDVPGELPPMPGWLLELAAPSAQAGSEPGTVRLHGDDVSAYAWAAVEREAGAVALAPAGQRNHRLNRAAFKLGQLVGAGLLDEAAATAALVAAGLAAGPGERKIRSTVRRGLRAGMRQPRRVLPA
jgi:hypothetical protein